MLLDDNDFFEIVMDTFLHKPKKSVCISIFDGVISKIILKLAVDKKKTVSPLIIYGDTICCFDYYNDFIKEKSVDVDPITSQQRRNFYEGICMALEVLDTLDYDEIERMLSGMENNGK